MSKLESSIKIGLSDERALEANADSSENSEFKRLESEELGLSLSL